MKTVLVADDNENNRYMLDKLLTGNGFRTILAKDGAEALAAARREPPDVIITDILMPVMDGFELCRQWKADEQLKRIPFMVYTATYTDPKDEKLILSLGADKFMIKPQQPEALLGMVREALAGIEGTVAARKPLGDEMEVLRQYNEVLFHKLEQKVSNLEMEVIERTRAEHTLANTVKALEESNAELEKFAFATSHDLQEPLRMITNYIGLLKKKQYDILGEESREYIDIVVKGAVRMSAMIKGLIDFSKISKVEKDFKPVDLNSVADEAKEIFRRQILESHAVVNAGKMPLVKGNRRQLVRLFENLICNSLKFGKKGEAPKLEITALRKDEQWLFCFRDNGIGISSKYFDRIFIIFETLHPKDEYEGNGIGLAQCKRIVDYHGGRIWVESEEGKGAAFYFTLPE